MENTTKLDTPTAAEKEAIEDHLYNTESRYDLEDVLDDYAGYVRWAAKRFPDEPAPTFTAWLAGSSWLED